MRTAIRAIIRVIIIIIFIQALITLIYSIANVYSYFKWAAEDYNLAVPIGIMVGVMLLATLILFVLWRKTDWLVRITAGEISEKELVITTSNLDLYKVAIRILGMYLVVTALPDLIGLFGYHLTIPRQSDYYILSGEINASEIRELLIIGVRLIAGIVLIIGSRKIVSTIDKIWDKARMVDNKNDSEE
jgi:hypothetical protein